MKEVNHTLFAKIIFLPILCPANIKVLVFIFLFANPFYSKAQTNDTTTYIRNDTVIKIIRPGNNANKLSGLKLEELLKQNSERNFFSRKLHEWLVKSSLIQPDSRELIPPDYTGKTINHIYIRNIPPFGGSVYDTTATADSWFERLGNRLRFPTAPGIIRKTITLDTGDLLEKSDIEDSERLLRRLLFINDARIIANLSPEDTSSVDLRVYVKDRYPHAIALGSGDDQTYVSLINKNLFGRGFSIENSLAVPTSQNSDWGFRETFRAINLGGRDINFEIDYAKIRNRHFILTAIDKSFLLPETRYAGGLSFNRSFINLRILDFPGIEWKPPLNFRRQNYWIGRSFRINRESKAIRSNAYLLARYMNLDMFADENYERPSLPGGDFYFMGVGFSKRNYYRNNLIYSYGKTEDVPYGFLSTISYGYHQGDTLSRHFAALHYSIGRALIPSNGYLYLSGDISTFFNKSNAEQGVLRLNAEYITSLMKLGTSRLRNFFALQYVRGFNRVEGESLYLDEDVDGLRSFDYENRLNGSEKAVFKSDQVFFTRMEPLGFKFAVFSFLDMAFIRESDQPLFRHSPYFSFGAGLRIRNDNLIFNTLQIRLAFMPRVPSGSLPASFRITGEPQKNFHDFAPTQPGISTYY